MKMLFIAILVLSVSTNALHAQSENNFNAIKLFIDPDSTAKENHSLSEIIQDRLYRKITQLINQTGIAEIGYSNFLVAPKLDVISEHTGQAGISEVYMVECELNIFIKRARFTEDGSSATFKSFSKTITGYGSGRENAVSNAITSLSSSDPSIVSFINNAKQHIDIYFKTHCKEVIKEAEQALSIKDYAQSIALYYSIPSTAPCYDEAFAAVTKVYVTFVEDQCNKRLILLKSYVALAMKDNGPGKNYYDSAIAVMRTLSPASEKCFAEAKVMISKIENRLEEKQRKEWELIRKRDADALEIEKEKYRAMGRINSTYQPYRSADLILVH